MLERCQGRCRVAQAAVKRITGLAVQGLDVYGEFGP